MKNENRMELKILGVPANESFARVCVGAFAAQLNPTLDEVADIKTAVSEAVTNAIIHGYPGVVGQVVIRASISDSEIEVEIEDSGNGIEDIDKARTPFYSTIPGEERSGMGFTVMETFMDNVAVVSVPGQGTKVIMKKQIGKHEE